MSDTDGDVDDDVVPLTVDQIIDGDFPAFSMPMPIGNGESADFDESMRSSADSSALVLDIDTAGVGSAPTNVDELRDTLDDELGDGSVAVLSSSWNAGLSVKYVSMDDDPDEVFGEGSSNAGTTIKRSESEPLLWEEDSESDSDYLHDNAIGAIRERYTPYGRVMVRRVRPVITHMIRRERQSTSFCDVRVVILICVCILNFGTLLHTTRFSIKCHFDFRKLFELQCAERAKL